MAEDKTYEAQCKAAQKAEAYERMNVEMCTWEKVGDVLIGRLVGVETLPETKFDTPVQRYLLQTDTALKSCLLGAATDKELAGKVRVGDLLRIEYRGKKEISGKRSVNLFDIQRFGHTEKP